MFEKCITCNRMGESCVPNLLLIPFPDLIKWWDKRQKYLGWSNQVLASKRNVPVGTINRLKVGDYSDCKFSTMRDILLSLIGGTTDEWACTEQVEREQRQMEQLEQQAAKLSIVEAENAALKERFAHLDELYRQELRAVKAEYQEEIAFLRDELKARRSK